MWKQPLLRVQRLVPGHLLAGIGSHPAHDSEHRAGGQALAVVHRLVLADGGEEQIVFPLVHIVLLSAEDPVGLALNARLGAAADGASAIRPEHVVGVLVVAAFVLPVRHEGSGAVRINVVDFEVIEDVAALGRNGASAHPDTTHGRFVVHGPRDLVDAMDRLFHQAVPT